MNKGKTSENFKSFKIPDNFFNKLFEFTGNQDENSKGFIGVVIGAAATRKSVTDTSCGEIK